MLPDEIWRQLYVIINKDQDITPCFRQSSISGCGKVRRLLFEPIDLSSLERTSEIPFRLRFMLFRLVDHEYLIGRRILEPEPVL